MGNRTSTEMVKKKCRSSSMTAKTTHKLINNNTSFISNKEQTLSRLSSGSKTGWPLPQREGVFLPEYPAKPALDFNDFRVLGHIGRGAFGHVLKVQRKTTGQVYAMKVLDKLEIFRQKAVQQCKDEIKIQSSLNCAFIVHARYAWQTKRHLYIILDYSERGDLFAVWTRLKRFNEDTVRQYIAEMAVALDFLHRSGVIYRDLKLENVLLDTDGHIKLTDFGLSKWLNQGTTTRTICGTIQYMAPEILKNESYTHAVDWWSLGVLMYAMLVGEYPFNATQSHRAMYEAILSNTCIFPLFVSQDAIFVMKRLLHCDPKRRLSSVDRLRVEPFFVGVAFDDLLHRAKTKMQYSPTWSGQEGKRKTFVKKTVDDQKKVSSRDKKEKHSEKEKEKKKHSKLQSKLKGKEPAKTSDKPSAPERMKYKPRHWGSGLTMNSTIDLRSTQVPRKRLPTGTGLATDTAEPDVRGRLRQHGCPSVPNCKEDEYSLCSSRTLPLHPYHNMHVQYHHQGHHTDNHSTRAGSVAGSISSSMHPGRYRQQLRYHRRSGWRGPGRPSRQSGEWGDSSSSSDGEVEWKGFGVL